MLQRLKGKIVVVPKQVMNQRSLNLDSKWSLRWIEGHLQIRRGRQDTGTQIKDHPSTRCGITPLNYLRESLQQF